MTLKFYFFKTLLLFFILLTLISFLGISKNQNDAILGKWISEEKDRKIEVYKEGNHFEGKIIWQVSGKFRAQVGDVVINDIQFSNPNWEGFIWVPEIKSNFRAHISMPKNNLLKIEAENGFIKKTKFWTRVN